MLKNQLDYRKLSTVSIANAIERGWSVFSLSRPVSVTYAMLFALIGLVILMGIEQASLAPMMLPLAGGFMLIGPTLLCGFFSVADRVATKRPTSLSDVVAGFRNASREILALAMVCMLLFLIWVTDAATLYGFMVGRAPVPLLAALAPTEGIRWFVMWSSVMGAALALIIFAISAFSVPLLYYRRAGLIQAVVLSVRVVLGNFVPCILWATILSSAIIVSILIFPLFLVVFPVLAFASHALYREVFPDPLA